jgi:hypothetical protein
MLFSVETLLFGTISSRVSRFLLGRHVLLFNVCHGRKSSHPTWYPLSDDLLQGIELFFCLYAREWADPVMCNSSNSRLLGFFTTLPGIWRALQCVRRYHDTKVVYPHLYNCGKYTWTILYYMTLSLYRVDKSHQMRALFIVCATINGIYCGKLFHSPR